MQDFNTKWKFPPQFPFKLNSTLYYNNCKTSIMGFLKRFHAVSTATINRKVIEKKVIYSEKKMSQFLRIQEKMKKCITGCWSRPGHSLHEVNAACDVLFLTADRCKPRLHFIFQRGLLFHLNPLSVSTHLCTENTDGKGKGLYMPALVYCSVNADVRFHLFIRSLSHSLSHRM